MPTSVIAADIDETPLAREAPRQLALRLSLAKAEKIAAAHPDAFVLAADTVVGCGRRILPKAESPDEVRACLKLLSGRRHRVYGGVALITPTGRKIRRIAESVVTFRRLTDDDILEYVNSGEGLGKAGGYAIQGLAARHIPFISGSYSNIVGLPVCETVQMLRGAGYPS